jgi:hypothetical protein
VFENRVLRRMLGQKRDEITGDGRKLMEEKRNACRILVGNPEGKRPLGRPRRRWEDNIRIDLREIGWGSIGWIDMAKVKTSG